MSLNIFLASQLMDALRENYDSGDNMEGDGPMMDADPENQQQDALEPDPGDVLKDGILEQLIAEDVFAPDQVENKFLVPTGGGGNGLRPRKP